MRAVKRNLNVETMIGMALFFVLIWSCKSEVVARHEGLASYYADKFQNQKTASGELYDTSKYTAAHRDWPFGLEVRVIRKDDGRSVVVKVNDRGPFNDTRIIDLSKAAAKDLGMLHEGILEVTLEVLNREE